MIKLTEANLKFVCNCVLGMLEDENGRGEFDEATGIEGAIIQVCEILESDVIGKEIIPDK